MKNMIIFATSYPYAAGVIAITWIGGAVLLAASPDLSFNLVLICNTALSVFVAAIGFRK